MHPIGFVLYSCISR